MLIEGCSRISAKALADCDGFMQSLKVVAVDEESFNLFLVQVDDNQCFAWTALLFIITEDVLTEDVRDR